MKLTPRIAGLFHAAFAVCNIILAIVCAAMTVKTYQVGMVPMCFFNAAIFVGNLYMVYFNYCAAKRLL
jgi:hypothetical protein